ncbi:MAG: hypothetical protein KFB96_08730 [Thiocapsa sp.]|uniref:hypothetical protein n=1 Tax=Thiocapsa sp. TaxID=2024551 RepID=UPI001BCF1916|nr:hypothetical protein [Thiocapsa sp.]QVL50490.1 MAG: hypothetical protein KFB96_08730 [Thiocapsa sp.]
MGEEREEPQHRDDLELHLLTAMRQLLGQRMELEIKDADTDHGDQHEDGHRHEQHIGFPRRGDEGWQVVDCGRVWQVRHTKMSWVRVEGVIDWSERHARRPSAIHS